MTAPGAARPGEPGWQHQTAGATQPPSAAAARPAAGPGQAPPPTVTWAGSAVSGSPGHATVPAGPAQAAYPYAAPAQPYTQTQAHTQTQTRGAAAASHPAQAAAATNVAATSGPPAQAGAAVSARASVAAQTTATESAAAAVARPRPLRSGIGTFHVAQLLGWQVAGAAGLAAYQHSVAATAAVSAGAALTLAPTLIRLRGRWAYQWLPLWLRYRLRPHRLPASGGNHALNLLSFVESSAALDTIDIDDQSVALIGHRGGLSAVFELDPADGSLVVGPPQPIPSPAELLPAADDESPSITVQVLIHVAPAPRVSLGPGVVDRSYRELTDGDVPAHRRVWVVLQAARTPDFYSDAELRPALTSAIRRTRRRLRRDQITARLLNRDELLAAVGYLAELPPQADKGNVYGAASGRMLAREGWQTWWTEQMPQTSHRLVQWPRMPWQVDSLLRQLPTLASVVSVAVTRDPNRTSPGDDVAVEVGFRLIARDANTLAAGNQALAEAVRRDGGRTERLDGEQVRGLAATLPLGGFLR
ncbi:type VII secretion protein EccE [Micromonospora polyrhachis]|uniref:Type VII secretion protein EccE n=1 Tax=Micromonospora polyrhachis TaxID=1282883 RepID=A0A7W7SLK4_9ACTN|nr:type VII secretion protein EccE [Micromonospora polyrhachis]MBB4957029.1 type VII secretion protein EccE [Micromonospora polyrhachis]